MQTIVGFNLFSVHSFGLCFVIITGFKLKYLNEKQNESLMCCVILFSCFMSITESIIHLIYVTQNVYKLHIGFFRKIPESKLILSFQNMLHSFNQNKIQKDEFGNVNLWILVIICFCMKFITQTLITNLWKGLYSEIIFGIHGRINW